MMRIGSGTRMALGGLAACACVATATSAQAQAVNIDCSTLTPPPVYVYGSSAVKPLIGALGASVYGTVTIVYIDKGGSCDGVNAIANNNLASGTGLYYPMLGTDGNPVIQNCDVPIPDGGAGGVVVDLGVSDVWPETCGVNPDYNTVGEFRGPNQVMTFVAPQNAKQIKNISAEAGYLVMGQPQNGKTVLTWTDGDKLAIRSAASGTQMMLGKAIGLDGSLWNGKNAGNSQGVEAAIKSANDTDAHPENWLGIVSTGEADNDRNFLKVLAFQPKGKKCAYWPDSSLTTFDKINVRTGLYDIWGPLHLLAKVPAQGMPPSNPAVKDIVQYLTGEKDPPGGPTQLLDLEIKNHVIPQCAMQKKRSSELAVPEDYKPAKPCGCYFEKKAGGDPKCTACTVDADCGDPAKICSFGFCEAK